MEWRCDGCGRTFHDPPAACPVCGSDVLTLGDGESPPVLAAALARIRASVFDPGALDRGLLDDRRYVAVGFWLLVAVSAAVAVALVVAVAF